MLDVIKLLPDSVANQIAAGEVIQRPASAVKELMENALDAGATQIDLVVKDAGKALIMVVDNGCGMSETDARLCFERHATSKISKAEDLFAIRTMGFRGEALASIAAIAQVELKTRRKEDEVGVKIVIEGSVVKEQSLVPMQPGTSFTVKNLFFNVPARRNFLKSPQAEMRHIVEQFNRVTLMNPEVGFTLTSDGKELYHLYSGNLKQRIMGLFGSHYDQKLLPVNQDTDRVRINGYIVKPEYAKKTRGEQYFFVNKRFIKHPYLHHAIENAFMEMIPQDSIPGYFINIEVDPADIDVNIHPTKTEVNFLDVKLVYAILHAAVRKAIGQHNLAPTIDFSETADMNADFGAAAKMSQPLVMPDIPINEQYNPFRTSSNTAPSPNYRVRRTIFQYDGGVTITGDTSIVSGCHRTKSINASTIECHRCSGRNRNLVVVTKRARQDVAIYNLVVARKGRKIDIMTHYIVFNWIYAGNIAIILNRRNAYGIVGCTNRNIIGCGVSILRQQDCPLLDAACRIEGHLAISRSRMGDARRCKVNGGGCVSVAQLDDAVWI